CLRDYNRLFPAEQYGITCPAKLPSLSRVVTVPRIPSMNFIPTTTFKDFYLWKKNTDKEYQERDAKYRTSIRDYAEPRYWQNPEEYDPLDWRPYPGWIIR